MGRTNLTPQSPAVILSEAKGDIPTSLKPLPLRFAPPPLRARGGGRGERFVAGFTLLEVSVALMILAMGLTVLLGGVRNGTQAFMRSRDMITVQALARHALALQQFDGTLPLDGDTRPGDFGADFPEYSYEIRYDLNDDFEAIRQAANLAQQNQPSQITHAVFVVTVSVFWEEDGARQTYKLQTARVYDTSPKQQ